ncbi:MAG: tetratricopeptide repeat protein [Opitutaceae bacterium]
MKQPKRPTSPRAVSAVAPESGGWPLGAVFATILAVTFAAYFPALTGELLWDDAGHVTRPDLQSWSGLARIWFEVGATQQYYPLLHSAFWIEHQLWGETTFGYHLVNVLWHATSACLLVAILRRLTVPGAVLAAFVFALHPVGVESVAWISEQKNTLSTVFYLAAALAWLRFEDERRPARYVAATLWFIAALLTKTVTASLPAALLVIAWWRRGRLSWRGDVLPLLPWFAAGAGAGLFSAWFERTSIGAQGADFNLSLVERGLLAGRVFWFYLGKLLWPTDLIFFYPRWRVDAAAAWQYLFPVAALALLGGLAWRTSRGRGRGLLAAALLYGGTLFPVLGFVNVYPFVFSYVADHFQYLASLSFFALAAAGLVNAGRSGRFGLPWRAAQALGVGVMVLLGALTWLQSKHYVDSITLYRATLARNPDSWIAHHNLGMELAARGAPADALPHARRALEMKPDYPEALNNVADNLTRTGRPAEALPLLERALQLQPRYAQAENNLGIALMTLGRAEEGVRHFQRAITLQPRLAEAHYNLGLANAERGDLAGAIAQFAETVRLRPDHAGAEFNWGVALGLNNRLAEARPHFTRALELNPDAASLHQTYGRVLLTAGQLDDALLHLREALRLDPTLSGLHRELATVLQRLGRTEEARVHALEAGRAR